ncbi:MAG TPA: MoaD/ThiS family protein [Chloroflexota bacterium]
MTSPQRSSRPPSSEEHAGVRVEVEVLSYLVEPFDRRVGERHVVHLDLPPGAVLRDLLERLAEENPRFAELAFHPGTVHVQDHVNILVNDRLFETLQGLDTPLATGDRVTFLPSFAGGAPPLAR